MTNNPEGKPVEPKKSAWENDAARQHWVNHEKRLAVSYNAATEASKTGPAIPAYEKFPNWLMRGWYEREYEPLVPSVLGPNLKGV